jgi:hypothetical protein
MNLVRFGHHHPSAYSDCTPDASNHPIVAASRKRVHSLSIVPLFHLFSPSSRPSTPYLTVGIILFPPHSCLPLQFVIGCCHSRWRAPKQKTQPSCFVRLLSCCLPRCLPWRPCDKSRAFLSKISLYYNRSLLNKNEHWTCLFPFHLGSKLGVPPQPLPAADHQESYFFFAA